MEDPAAPARPWRTWLPLAAAYGLAFAVRAWLLGAPLYGDEAAHYYVARHLGASPANLVPHSEFTHWLFWQRPLFSLLLWPGAAVSFEGYRLWHALLASLLAPLVMAVLAQAGARRWTQVGAGVVVALLPAVVGWGVRVFPDSLMAVLVLAGILLHGRGLHGRAAAAFLAAVWVKEVAAVAILAAFLASVLAGLRRSEVGLWPLRLSKPATAYFAAGLLAPAGLAISVFVLHGQPPGWSTSEATLELVDGLFASAWLLPAVLLGLKWPRTRRLALWALVFPLFYAVYGFALRRGVEGWYMVLPQVLAVAAAALALEEAARQSGAPWRRVASHGAAAALAVLLVASAVLPGGAGALAQPVGGSAQALPDLHASLAAPHPLDAAVAALPLTPATDVFVVDVDWFYTFYPFAETANSTAWALTFLQAPLSDWARVVEGPRATLVGKNDRPLNVALRQAYADCSVWENDGFAILHGHACPGRVVRLQEELRKAGG